MKKDVEKTFYSTLELVGQSWFPIKSTLTLKKLIESGELKAIDISTSKRFKRYRIFRDSVEKFLLEKGKIEVKKKLQKKTKVQKKIKKNKR